MSLRSSLIGAAKTKRRKRTVATVGGYVPEGTGLAVKSLHPPPVFGGSTAFGYGKLIASMGDGKSTVCLLIALYPLLDRQGYSEVTPENYIIVWGENLAEMFAFVRLEFERRAAAGRAPVWKVCLILNDARKHHAGHHQGADAREAEDLLALVRHEIRRYQAAVGWPVGGVATLLVNAQSRTSVGPFLRANAHSNWAFAYPMDPDELRKMISEFASGNKETESKVLAFLERVTTKRVLGDRTANSEALCKIRTQHVLQVDFQRLYNLLEAHGPVSEEFYERLGVVHIVRGSPRAEEEHPLEALVEAAGGVAQWSDDAMVVKAAVWQIAHDPTSPERVRLQASVGQMRGLWGMFNALYHTRQMDIIRSEPEEAQRAPVVPELDAATTGEPLHALKMRVFAWALRDKIELSSRDDSASGFRPKALLRVLELAALDPEFGVGAEGLWASDKLLTEWLRKNKVEIRARYGVMLHHARWKGRSAWYIFPGTPALSQVASDPATCAPPTPVVTVEVA